MQFYRSQTVDRFRIYLPRQSAWNIVNNLGKQQLVHIIPSKSTQTIRHFTLQIKRIQEAIQKVQNLEDILVQKKMVQLQKLVEKEKFKDISYVLQSYQSQQNDINKVNKINQVIQNVDQLWQYYVQTNKRIQMLDKQIKNARQSIAILLAGQKQYGKSFFQNQRERSKSYDKIIISSFNKINFKSGVIHIEDQLRFKKTVFRITKGNCLVTTKQFSQIFPQMLKYQQQRVVFFIVFPANNQSYFQRKLSKLVSNFCDKNFQFSNGKSFDQSLQELNKIYTQASNLKIMCESQIDRFLSQKLMQRIKGKQPFSIGMQKYEYLKLYLFKQKAIYHCLNQMDIFNHFFQGQIFVRKQQVKKVQEILSLVQDDIQLPPGNIVPIQSSEKYPSSFVLNDYTLPAQQIVETYGVPRYKQINPSLFTTITFPFLFGVMFGDIGHGLIVLGFGAFLVLKKQQIKRMNIQMLSMLLPYRYFITLMGFFACYCGLIYNDFLSISLNTFGSCYSLQNINQGQQITRISNQCVYSIGLDPVWSVADNSLNYTNSLKMKISVIIGVIHMTLGVFVRALNNIHFRNYKELAFIFVPQLLFLLSLFGYMDFIIIYKWLVPWGTQRDTSLAPSIITQMIDIPLSLGSTQGKPLWNVYSQESVQFVLLIIAGISIPLMFFPVPLLKIYKIQKRRLKPKKIKNKKIVKQMDFEMQNQLNEILINRQTQYIQQQKQLHLSSQQSLQEESTSEIVVHQVIETIEYVLGCVSNTASYLRLWALSLAHSQLSEVFFEKTVEGSLEAGWSGIPMNIIGFVLLAGVTMGIMLLMDTMECFLHTLRLHWVQFQNKFYKGDGISFVNFSFLNEINQELRKKNL